MSDVPDDLKYTESDEWVKIEDGKMKMGITDHAQGKLTDIVGVWDLPEEGAELSKGDIICTIESVKASAEMYAPVDGKVVETNISLEEEPEKVNSDPYGEGWVVVMEIGDQDEPEGLMGAEEYSKRISE